MPRSKNLEIYQSDKNRGQVEISQLHKIVSMLENELMKSSTLMSWVTKIIRCWAIFDKIQNPFLIKTL